LSRKLARLEGDPVNAGRTQETLMNIFAGRRQLSEAFGSGCDAQLSLVDMADFYGGGCRTTTDANLTPTSDPI
jgi:hypothetical protein